jgi:hypothetical protein
LGPGAGHLRGELANQAAAGSAFADSKDGAIAAIESRHAHAVSSSKTPAFRRRVAAYGIPTQIAPGIPAVAAAQDVGDTQDDRMPLPAGALPSGSRKRDRAIVLKCRRVVQ